MTNGKRIALSAAAGLTVVLVVTVIRGALATEPGVSYGIGGPGFLGAMAAFVTWWITDDKPDGDR
ncbi:MULTISPECIES: hypothetical protein [unclassified Thioalkalivibrio]|uniref:hypothetical protein n=1 Tax=unclassified Thioalkalivibrio TaxID=2621013 RepID=UPI0003A858B7|nr:MULTISPECIES: hypothetical protein [unclassified Thioalkalivibrio]